MVALTEFPDWAHQVAGTFWTLRRERLYFVEETIGTPRPTVVAPVPTMLTTFLEVFSATDCTPGPLTISYDSLYKQADALARHHLVAGVTVSLERETDFPNAKLRLVSLDQWQLLNPGSTKPNRDITGPKKISAQRLRDTEGPNLTEALESLGLPTPRAQ